MIWLGFAVGFLAASALTCIVGACIAYGDREPPPRPVDLRGSVFMDARPVSVADHAPTEIPEAAISPRREHRGG